MEFNGRDEKENQKLTNASNTALSLPAASDISQAKITSILDACRWKDVELLRALATSEGGLVSDSVRREACSFPIRVKAQRTQADETKGHFCLAMQHPIAKLSQRKVIEIIGGNCQNTMMRIRCG